MSNDKLARSVALEQAYVHDVYEQFNDNPRSKPWPRVQEFIENLEPGSIVCDVGESLLEKIYVSIFSYINYTYLLHVLSIV